jgi:hypothetical protein
MRWSGQELVEREMEFKRGSVKKMFRISNKSVLAGERCSEVRPVLAFPLAPAI